MELGSCTLEEVMKKRKKVGNNWSEDEILKIAFGLISAMSKAVSYGINHRDISLNNIVLSKDFDDYKLIDFGEGLHFIDNQEELPVAGKYYFMAPEI